LAYYFPLKFGLGKLTAYDMEHKGHFGISVPASLAGLMVQFCRVPKYFKKLGLQIVINDYKVNSFFDFCWAIIFSRMAYEQAIINIEKMVDCNEATGVDIGVMYWGLANHVLFVYGYDDENLYVFETIRAPIQYENIDTKYPNLMKLPKTEIKKRWTRFGRVWNVVGV
jgi:hypothetical protein